MKEKFILSVNFHTAFSFWRWNHKYIKKIKNVTLALFYKLCELSLKNEMKSQGVGVAFCMKSTKFE